MISRNVLNVFFAASWGGFCGYMGNVICQKLLLSINIGVFIPIFIWIYKTFFEPLVINRKFEFKEKFNLFFALPIYCAPTYLYLYYNNVIVNLFIILILYFISFLPAFIYSEISNITIYERNKNRNVLVVSYMVFIFLFLFIKSCSFFY
jgi:hypothetical protein